MLSRSSEDSHLRYLVSSNVGSNTRPTFHAPSFKVRNHAFSQQRRWDLRPSLTHPKRPLAFSPNPPSTQPPHSSSGSLMNARHVTKTKVSVLQGGGMCGRCWKPWRQRASTQRSCNSVLSPQPAAAANLFCEFHPFYFPPDAVLLPKDSMTNVFSKIITNLITSP